MFASTLSLAAGVCHGQILHRVGDHGRRVFTNDDRVSPPLSFRRSKGPRNAGMLHRRKQALPGIDAYIDRVAGPYEIDPEVVRALIEVESAWDPRARSAKGALGLMQLMPETAARFNVREPFNPHQNIAGGVRYLSFLLERFKGNLRLALAGYNAGENAVVAHGDVPPFPETRTFLERIAARYEKLRLGAMEASPTRIYTRVSRNGRLVFANE